MSSVLLETSSGIQTIERATKVDRNSALDFTKGALVLIMVLYHWMNYFTDCGWTCYRYLHFLTPSFILVSGFLISNIYLSKYHVSDPRLWQRLSTRGVKLLAVFVVLNAARSFLFPRLPNGSIIANYPTLKNVMDVFVSGDVPITAGKVVAFSILVPISYLLLLSAGLLLPYRFYKHTFHVVCVFCLACILALDVKGVWSPNLEFVTIGLLGVLAGFIPLDKINRVVRHPYALAIAYFCYTVAITVWNVPFPLLVVGACLSVLVIYLLGLREGQPGRARRHVILLGKYSLLGYIAQIAILQLLSAGLRHIDLRRGILSVSFLAAFALTMLTVEAVDRVKTRSTMVNKLYRAVFA